MMEKTKKPRLRHNSHGKTTIIVLVTVSLILSMLNIPAFADLVAEGQVSEGETPAVEVASDEVLISFKTENSYVEVNGQVVSGGSLVVPPGNALTFSVYANDGFAVADVSARDAEGSVAVNSSSVGHYSIAANHVTDGLVVKVTTTVSAETVDAPPVEEIEGSAVDERVGNADEADEAFVEKDAEPSTEPVEQDAQEGSDSVGGSAPSVDGGSVEHEGAESSERGGDTQGHLDQGAVQDLVERTEETVSRVVTSTTESLVAVFSSAFGFEAEMSAFDDSETYTVIFKLSDGTVVDEQEVSEGTLAVAPETDPALQVYGWYFEGTTTLFNAGQPITEDVILVAAVGNKHLVSYCDYDGGVFSVVEVDHGEDFSALTPPVASEVIGEEFSFWSADPDGSTPFSGPINANVTLYPQYVSIVMAVFVSNGGPAIETQVVDSTTGFKITEPAAASMIRTGYAFSHWTADPTSTDPADAFDFSDPISATTYLYAVWTAQSTGYVLNYWVEKEGLGLDDPGTDTSKYYLIHTRVIDASHALAGTTGKKLNNGDGSDVITSTIITNRNNYTAGGASVYDVLDYCDFNWTDAGEDGKELSGSGGTVINVYAKRIVYTANFNLDATFNATSGATPLTVTVKSPALEAGRSSYAGSGEGFDADGNMTFTGGMYTMKFKLGEKVGAWWPYSCAPKAPSTLKFVNWNGYHGNAQDGGGPTINKGYIRCIVMNNSSSGTYNGSDRMVGRNPSGTLRPQMEAASYHETRFYFTELTPNEKADGALIATAVLSTEKAFLDDPSSYEIVNHKGNYYRFNWTSSPGNYQKSWSPQSWPGASIDGFQTIMTSGSFTTKNYQSVIATTATGPTGLNTINNGTYNGSIQGNICYFMPRVKPTLTLFVGDGASISNATGFTYASNAYKKTLVYGDDIVLPSNDPVKSGSTFEGWYLDADFSEPYDPSALPTMPSSSLTLYAKFVGEKITVNYYSDFSTNTSSLICSTDDYVGGDVLSESDLDTAMDYNDLEIGDVVPGKGIFKGWYFKAPGSTLYTNAQWGMPLSYAPGQNATVYNFHASFDAQGEKFSVTFMVPSGASDVGNNTAYVQSGAPILVPSGTRNTLALQGYVDVKRNSSVPAINDYAPQIPGYTFLGWFTLDSSGDYKSVFKTNTRITSNVTVYARFLVNVTISIGDGEKVYGTSDSDPLSAETVTLSAAAGAHSFTYTPQAGDLVRDTGEDVDTYDTALSVAGLTHVKSKIISEVGQDYKITVITEGAFDITPRELIVTAASDTKIYDATALANSAYTVAAYDAVAKTGLVAPDAITGVTVSGSQVQAGTAQNIPSNVVFAQGTNADNYKVTYVQGSLVVTPAELYITTGSAAKVYDNTALTAGGEVKIGADGVPVEFGHNGALITLPNGDTVTLATTATITEVGTVSNAYTLVWNGTAQSGSYRIVSEQLGALVISQNSEKIIVTTRGGTWRYDGQTHGGTVESFMVPSGYTVANASTSAAVTNTTTGAVAATADDLVITNAQGAVVYDRANKVNKGLNVVFVDGDLRISEALLTVTTPHATKVHDGTPLVAAGSVSGLVNGETVGFTTTGSRTKVGSCKNSYTLTFNGSAKKSNYTVVEDLGVLTVTAAAVVPPVDPKVPGGGLGTTTPPTSGLKVPDVEAPDTQTAPMIVIDPVASTVMDVAESMGSVMGTFEGMTAIDDEDTPLASQGGMGAFAHCWVHWYLLLGIVVSALYSVVVIMRRKKYIDTLRDYEDNAMGYSKNDPGSSVTFRRQNA